MNSPVALLSQLARNATLHLDIVEYVLDTAFGAFEPVRPGADENRAGNTLFFLLALVVTSSDLARPSRRGKVRGPLM